MGENLIRNRVLRGGTGLRGAPKDKDGIRKFFPSCKTRQEWGKIKPCRVGLKTPSWGEVRLQPHPIAISIYKFYYIELTNECITNDKRGILDIFL